MGDGDGDVNITTLIPHACLVAEASSRTVPNGSHFYTTSERFESVHRSLLIVTLATP